MRLPTFTLSIFLTTVNLFAQETLQFIADIKSEELAEEAIDLMQCLAERSSTSWELSGSATSQHYLAVSEKTLGRLRVQYQNGDKSSVRELVLGGAESTCDAILPPQKVTLDLSPIEPSSLPILSEGSKKSNAWLWAGAIIAVASGYLIWKSSHGPRYRSVFMN